jgi:hypothetical protein
LDYNDPKYVIVQDWQGGCFRAAIVSGVTGALFFAASKKKENSN